MPLFLLIIKSLSKNYQTTLSHLDFFIFSTVSTVSPLSIFRWNFNKIPCGTLLSARNWIVTFLNGYFITNFKAFFAKAICRQTNYAKIIRQRARNGSKMEKKYISTIYKSIPKQCLGTLLCIYAHQLILKIFFTSVIDQ